MMITTRLTRLEKQLALAGLEELRALVEESAKAVNEALSGVPNAKDIRDAALAELLRGCSKRGKLEAGLSFAKASREAVLEYLTGDVLEAFTGAASEHLDDAVLLQRIRERLSSGLVAAVDAVKLG